MAARKNLDKTLKTKEAWIWEQVRAAVPLKQICKELDIAVSNFQGWVKRDPERQEEYLAAKRDSAEAHMDRAREVLEARVEDPELTSAQSGLVKALSGHHARMAEVRDRETFGKGADVQVNVLTAGEDFAAALTKHGQRLDRLAAPAPNAGNPFHALRAERLEAERKMIETRKAASEKIVDADFEIEED